MYGGGNFEDQPVKLPPGSVPETYPFNCPGDKCKNMCKPEKKAEVEPPKPVVRSMPKTDKCQCSPPPPPASKQNNDTCVDEPPPPITCKLPETATFKCTDDKCGGGKPKEAGNVDECAPQSKEDKGSVPEVKDECAPEEYIYPTCGKGCKCGGPVAPIPKIKPPCGCRGSTSCGPNTSCEVQPLMMVLQHTYLVPI